MDVLNPMKRCSHLFFLCLPLLLAGGCGGDRNDPPQDVVLYPSSINDSGRTGCATATELGVSCEGSVVAVQDGATGRDWAEQKGLLLKFGRGDRGFDFTRLAGDGMSLSVQDGAWSGVGSNTRGTFWECVLDNTTGLVWEVKHADPSHPRWVGSTYSWYSTDAAGNGGFAGTENGGSCNAGRCDTEGYVTYVNGLRLCGYDDWRMPQVSELLSIAHQGRETPAIDLYAFPNSRGEFQRYWTGDTAAEIPQIAWYVYFSDGSVSFTQKTNASHTRLVRSDND